MPDQRRRPAGPPKLRPSRLLDDLAMEVDVETFDLGLFGHPETERHVEHLEDDEGDRCGTDDGRDGALELYPNLAGVALETAGGAFHPAGRNGEHAGPDGADTTPDRTAAHG